MKKNIIIALMATTLLLAGCSSNTTNSEVKDEPTKVEDQEDKDKASEVESEEPASETETTDDVKFADMIPDPNEIFANGQIYINDLDGGKSYFFKLKIILKMNTTRMFRDAKIWVLQKYNMNQKVTAGKCLAHIPRMKNIGLTYYLEIKLI